MGRSPRVVVIALAGALGACATNPATGQSQLILMSDQQEIELGRQADQDVRKEMGVYDDPQLQQYLDRVGHRLSAKAHRPNLPWTFTVVDQQAVNAFALPGGFIYITRGILPFLQNEAQLAAVLGHEVGHVDARHAAQAYSRQTLAGGGLALLGILVPETQPAEGLAALGLNLLFLRNSRENELQADQLGVQYASAAGWTPEAMTNVLTMLGRLDTATGTSRGVPNWAMTHPPAEDRVAKVQAAVVAARTLGGDAIERSAYEQQIDGIVYGDSREQGVVRGHEFLHPVLRFALQFPDHWDISNGAQQVSARANDAGTVAMVLEPAPQGGGSVEQVARTNMSQAGFTETAGQPTQINGLSAYVGTYSGTINTVQVTLRAAHIRNGDQTYLLAGFAPPAQFSVVEAPIAAAIRSFRPLSAVEAARIQPDRIDFRVVRSGDTWESLARLADGRATASALAIMNGADPSAPPRAGERIRVVVAG